MCRLFGMTGGQRRLHATTGAIGRAGGDIGAGITQAAAWIAPVLPDAPGHLLTLKDLSPRAAASQGGSAPA